MTEREKMLSGQLYNCGDPELLNQWHKAKNLMRDYSLVDSVNLEEKDRILDQLLGGRGKICGLPPRSMWTTATTFTSATTAK